MTQPLLTRPLLTQRSMTRRSMMRRLVPAAVALLLALGVLAPGTTAQAAEIEGYAAYDPQTTCVRTAGAGTTYLLGWLVGQYPRTGSGRTLSACSGSSVSEHKDGRALDWVVDASRRGQRLKARSLLDRILATDVEGNQRALGRRMGIMYVIWNDHIWASYRSFERRDYLSSGCKSIATCSPTLRHRDHMHISLSRAGAAAQTSFYLSEAAGPPTTTARRSPTPHR